ncbi:hypothetical protein J2P12_07970, partial [Candidatus Bathyarchaeota archaeon]|nr:hypothetical protein [Candidatus Bathyarchaeota archaeon]
NDQVKGIAYGNGLVTNYTYTKLGQTSTIRVKNGSTVLLYLAYSYNKTGTVGIVTGNITNTSGVSSKLKDQYRYDQLQRLLYANNTVGSLKTVLQYTYDTLGNRLSQTLNGVSTSYTYDSNNSELKTAMTTNGPSIFYSYYPNGNLKTSNVTVGGNTNHWSYAWNIPGNLLSVTNNTMVQGYYAYDGLGRRIEAKEGASTTFYSYTGTETLSDQFTSGASNNYVYANGLRIARMGEYVSTYYYHVDALGSTRLVTDANHSIVFSDSYQAYGQDNSPSGTEALKFTGKPVSQTTGLYYEYSRWYDPSIGRFISQDSDPGHRSDPQSLNYYVYVQNNPTSNTDPTGHFLIEALIGAAVGAAVGYGWCVASTGGWTSSECGYAALGGAASGALIGLTDGASLLLESGAGAGGALATDELVNTSDFFANTESVTTTITTDTTSSISTGATPVISSTSSGSTISIITDSSGQGASLTSKLFGGEDPLVVRGGLNTPQSLDTALLKGGISANSAPGATVEQLSQGLPHTNIGVTTVGSIRGIGGDVISDATDENPFHVIIVPGPGGTQELSALFDIRPNPWKVPR